MQIKIDVPGPESNVPPSDRRAVNVETHEKRGDSFAKVKSQLVTEGDGFTFNVPDGGRLVLDMPLAQEPVVMDRDQNAAIAPTRQANDAGRADKPTEGVQPVVKPAPSQTTMTPNLDAQGRPLTPQNPPVRPATVGHDPNKDMSAPKPAGQPPHGVTGGQDSKDVKK